MQKVMNKLTDDATKNLQAQTAANNALLQSQQNNTSWLSAHAGASANSGNAYVEVPVIIDGREVFRAVQKGSLLNNRRNTSNGVALSGSVI